MIAELELFGLLVSPFLLWSLAALALSVVVRQALRACGAERLVWHKPLWNLALFVLLLRAVSALASR